MSAVLVWTYTVRGMASVLFVLGLVLILVCIRFRLEIRGRKFAPLAGATAFGGVFYVVTLVNLYVPLYGVFAWVGLPSLVSAEGAALWGAFVGLHWSLAVVVVFGYRVYQQWSLWMPLHKLFSS